MLLFAVFMAWPVLLVDPAGPPMADSVLLAAMRLVDQRTWTLTDSKDPGETFQTLAHDISIITLVMMPLPHFLHVVVLADQVTEFVDFGAPRQEQRPNVNGDYGGPGLHRVPERAGSNEDGVKPRPAEQLACAGELFELFLEGRELVPQRVVGLLLPSRHAPFGLSPGPSCPAREEELKEIREPAHHVTPSCTRHTVACYRNVDLRKTDAKR